MKKIRTISLLISVLLILCVTHTSAQSLYVAGVEVTADNCDSITGDFISGHVSYNFETQTLTLDDAHLYGIDLWWYQDTITAEILSPRIKADNLNLTINLSGNNSISQVDIPLWFTNCDTVRITGDGNLIIGNSSIELNYFQYGILLWNTSLLQIAGGVHLTFPSCDNAAIASYLAEGGGRSSVLIDSSSVTVNQGKPFSDISNLTLVCSHIEEPEGALFSQIMGAVVTASGEFVTTHFEIVPGSGTAVPQYLGEKVGLSVWPNPAHDYLNVQCTVSKAQQWDGATVKVFDVYGKLLQTERMSSETTTLNICGLPAGVYVLRVTDADGKEYRQKVVRR